MKTKLTTSLLAIVIVALTMFQSTTVVAQFVILGHTEELIECTGAEDLALYVSAKGAYESFQWYLDGTILPGEKLHVLRFEKFDYTVSGIYTCVVSGAGEEGTVTVSTAPIPVYALTAPEVVTNPQEVINAVLGEDYTFFVEVHYRGIIPPWYKDDFQWYKVNTNGDTLELEDNDRIAGSNGSILSFRDLQANDICQKGEYYFVKVIGQCGTVYSDPFLIAQGADVVFNLQPVDAFVCPGENVIYTATAVVPTGFTVSYVWKQDGNDIVDGAKFNGVNTNTLQVMDVIADDQADYTCVATIDGQTIEAISNAAGLELKELPIAEVKDLGVTETDMSVKRGNDVVFQVNLLAGDSKSRVEVKVEWLFNNEIVKEGLWSQFDGDLILTYDISEVETDQSGTYTCHITNACEETTVTFNLEVTKWDDANSVKNVSKNGYVLFANTPNPVVNSTTINYEMANASNVNITLFDANGKKVANLYNGFANKGMNSINVNVNNYNSGVYFYSIEAPTFNATLPMIINK